ncbi:STAS-domain containing protein PA14_20770 [Pseudomonas sp. 8BK]|jgi:anti-anti-sigma factor|uniref:Anti-anti-sigma factor n=1 Tax=Pseudomonas anguilliseptica TaxID=53406 RepID=A0A1H5CZJ0_PSEAG|nr:MULTISPECIES: STAS domain-containing protein [Pseudomonas]MCZ4324101.1 STAS domain-containing protein [Pseudomonas anguilliseptica]WNF48218.1 STAS domain-containing protein [Pseudomonas sp. SG20056]SED72021.1 anti-anti-sigma factor [Pseudomonas anguilliseptica]VXC15046.1 STAS-domain containing protein PA14_20770 [Pseudomonas sp. 8BK]
MAITSLPSSDGQELTILIQGRFDFGAHQEFRNAYERVNTTPQRYVVDLKDTTYLDSSALGMLLLLRDHAGGDSAQIRLLNCNPDVRKILAISNFEQLFKIA